MARSCRLRRPCHAQTDGHRLGTICLLGGPLGGTSIRQDEAGNKKWAAWAFTETGHLRAIVIPPESGNGPLWSVLTKQHQSRLRFHGNSLNLKVHDRDSKNLFWQAVHGVIAI